MWIHKIIINHLHTSHSFLDAKNGSRLKKNMPRKMRDFSVSPGYCTSNFLDYNSEKQTWIPKMMSLAKSKLPFKNGNFCYLKARPIGELRIPLPSWKVAPTVLRLQVMAQKQNMLDFLGHN